ncbi:MAG: hypothetical protein ACLQVG_03495 [Terriglobia bacterium]
MTLDVSENQTLTPATRTGVLLIPNSLVMLDKPEDKARKTIDDLLSKAGWTIQDREGVNVSAARGVAIREFPLKSGYGFADYLLYVDGAPAGVVEAKKEGETLTGYEIQTENTASAFPTS